MRTLLALGSEQIHTHEACGGSRQQDTGGEMYLLYLQLNAVHMAIRQVPAALGASPRVPVTVHRGSQPLLPPVLPLPPPLPAGLLPAPAHPEALTDT